MDCFTNIIQRAGNVTKWMCVVFLLALALLTVTSVITRIFDIVIIGSVELSGFLIGTAVASSLGFTAVVKGHIVIDILVSRFSQRLQAILTVFTSIIGIGVCILIVCANISKGEWWLEARGPVLGIPYIPFISLWVLSLIFLSLVLLRDLFEALGRIVKMAGKK